jgi:hypothetical protein
MLIMEPPFSVSRFNDIIKSYSLCPQKIGCAGDPRQLKQFAKTPLQLSIKQLNQPWWCFD